MAWTPELFDHLRVNRSAVERRTASLPKRRSVKKDYQAAWLLKAISCMDLTTLSGDDTPGKVRRLCQKAMRPVRRDILEKFGGFAALANYLADDFMLGQKVVGAGYRIALAPYIVQNVIYEAGLRGLFLHELRWARTIRSVQPIGNALSFVTDILPLSLLASVPIYLATASMGWALAVPGCALALRLLLHFVVSRIAPPGTICAPWLIPVRDLLSVAVRVSSFFGSRVQWRERSLVIHANNQLSAAE